MGQLKKLVMLMAKVPASSTIWDATATWNPADKGTNATLSGGNLTAFITVNTTAWVRASVGKDASGHCAFEVRIDSHSGPYALSVGLTDSSAVTNYMFQRTPFAGVYAFNGSRDVNGTNTATAPWNSGFVDTDVFGFVLNAGTLTAYKNGVLIGTVTTGLTGTQYPVIGTGASSGTSITVTAKFTALTYTYP